MYIQYRVTEQRAYLPNCSSSFSAWVRVRFAKKMFARMRMKVDATQTLYPKRATRPFLGLPWPYDQIISAKLFEW